MGLILGFLKTGYILIVLWAGAVVQLDGPYSRADCLIDLRHALALGIEAECQAVGPVRVSL